MEEQHRLAVRTDLGLAIAEHPRAFLHQRITRRENVRYFVADVMNAAVGVALDELRNRRVLAERLYEIDLVGIPEKNMAGEELDEIVFDAVVSTIETLPRARRRDPDALAESVRRAVRATVANEWGKKPLCYVHVLEV